MYTLGLDISPAQSAATLVHVDEDAEHPLRTAAVAGRWAVTGRAGIAKKLKDCGRFMMLRGTRDDPEVHRLQRLAALRWLLTKVHNDLLSAQITIVLAVIEGFAYGAKGTHHDAGGAGDLARFVMVNRGYRVRIINPGTLKKFVAHKGNADEEAYLEAFAEMWPDAHADLWRYRTNPARGKPYATTAEGLCDGFGLAVIGAAEKILRAGTHAMADVLLHPKEREVFHAVDKTGRTLLERPYLTRETVGT